MKEPKNSQGDEFIQNIKANVKPKSTLVLGISGGADSMYLLHRCLWLIPELHLKLVVAHVNHGLRGKESDQDERFVKDFCKRNGIIFHSHRLNLTKKTGARKNIEEAGRDGRYKYFETLRKKVKAQWIVTAHHLNDNIETMLFNLIRGAHFNGIKAMSVVSFSRKLLRPMLGLTKKEILDCVKKNRIQYREDSSNMDTNFSRNWMRKKILPLFPKLNASFEKTFKETLNNFSETADWLEHQCEKWIKENGKNMVINLDAFLKEHKGFQKQLLANLYQQIHGSTNKLANKHLEEILKVLHLQKSNTKKEFGKDTFIEVIWEPKSERGSKKKQGSKSRQRYIRLTTKK